MDVSHDQFVPISSHNNTANREAHSSHRDRDSPTSAHDTTNSLSPIEAQRAIAIVEETVEKLSFLGSITPDVLQHRDELSRFVGDEISRIIHDQRQLELRYEELITERTTLKGLANKIRYREVQSQIAEVSRLLRESTKQLCRNLKDNPNIHGNLVKIQRERQDLIEVLGASMKELREHGTFHRIRMEVRAHEGAAERMKSVVERERTMAVAVEALDRDLTEEKIAHQQAMTSQRATVVRLKEELQALKSATTVEATYARKSEFGQTASQVRTSEKAERKAEAEIKVVVAKLETEKVVHSESSAFLEKKALALHQDKERWVERHEDDLGGLEAEYEQLKEKQLANRERLDALQARKKKDDEVEAKRAAAAQAQADEEAKTEAEHAVKTKAALSIQKQARGYLKRKAARDAAGGKKKKGGKKGKKKK